MTPLGATPPIGCVKRFARETGLLSLSVNVKSGALAPTRGAAAEAGMCRAETKIANTKKPNINALRPARIGPKIFPRYDCGRRKARRIPAANKPAAIAKSSRLAQGKLRVEGNSTKNAK